MESLSPDVRDHEPRLALDGGPDGLAFYRRIVAGAGAFIKPGGWLLVEVGYTQAEAVVELVRARGDYLDPTMAKDSGGRTRVVMASRK